MSRLTTLAVIVFTVAAAALLSVHLVSANALSAANTPILSSLYRSSGPEATGTPSESDSGAVAPGNANAPADQEASEPQGQDPQDAQDRELTGTVASVDSAKHAFVLTAASGPVTVITTGQTEFEDGVSALGDLRTGMAVSVEGARQSDGSVIASQAKGPSDSSENSGGSASQTSDGND